MAENVESLGLKLLEEQKKLDKFNLNVAEYRLQNGMSPQLKMLYREMGSYVENLEMMLQKSQYIQESFRKIYMKENPAEIPEVPF